MKTKLYWLIQDTKYWIDSKLCPVQQVKEGRMLFRFPRLHTWLCKDFPDAW